MHLKGVFLLQVWRMVRYISVGGGDRWGEPERKGLKEKERREE